MSRSSRPVLSLLIFTLALSPLYCAPASDTAILSTGPNVRHGLPYISANVIEYYEATYEAPAHASSPLSVLFTKTDIPPNSSWQPGPCRTYPVLSVSTSPPVYFYARRGEWSLLFVFPGDFRDPCAFSDAFIDRFLYFLGITRGQPLSSFPAVLQLGG